MSVFENCKKQFLLIGHSGFYNKGCEAIVRSTHDLLGRLWPERTSVLFSLTPEEDQKEIINDTIVVVPGAPKRLTLEWALRVITSRGPNILHPLVYKCNSLYYKADAGLSIGGDNYSLDYGSPLGYVTIDRHFMISGVRPYVIWGASIGPFEENTSIRTMMIEHLKRVDLITARESFTVDYLKSIGVSKNVVKVYDPAFALAVECYKGPENEFMQSGDILGLNISPLIAGWRTDKSIDTLSNEVICFIKHVVNNGMKVILIPHVHDKNNPLKNNDSILLSRIYSEMLKETNAKDYIVMLKGNVPASQIKWVISKCKYFIGARTHATIAALSTGVPTISIAYSQKARGITHDIFGHDDYVLETPDVSKDALLKKLELLYKHEKNIQKILLNKRNDMIMGAEKNVEALGDLLSRKPWSKNELS